VSLLGKWWFVVDVDTGRVLKRCNGDIWGVEDRAAEVLYGYLEQFPDRDARVLDGDLFPVNVAAYRPIPRFASSWAASRYDRF
jgi:hypothetical protein